MKHNVKILSIEHVTHDVLGIVAEKPASLNYEPGQAVDVAINKKGWEEEWRSFTFTSLPTDEKIQFTIKTYPSHKGVTNELLSLKPGDELIINDVYGDIKYKGEGIFLAGGAGVTPFLAIFKDLKSKNQIGNNKLIFGNKTKADIIQEDWFKELLGENFINVLSEEEAAPYEHGHITAELIRKNTDPSTKYFYLCGPGPMMDAMEKHFETLDIKKDAVVKEAF